MMANGSGQTSVDGELSRFEISDAEMQRYRDGKSELYELLEMSPELLEQLRGRTQFFLDGGHDERALIMLEMLEELDRTSSVSTLLAIDVLLRLGFSDRAEEKVAHLLARDAADPEARVAKAQLELSTGRWHDAAETLAGVIDEDPDGDKPATRRAMALAHAACERFEASR